MDDPGRVGLLQRVAGLPHEMDRPARRQRPVPRDQGLQVGPGQVLHRDVVDAVVAHAEVVHLDAVGDPHLAGGLGLALEAPERAGIGDAAGPEQLERDVAPEREVPRQPDLPHPAPADGCLQPVAAEAARAEELLPGSPGDVAARQPDDRRADHEDEVGAEVHQRARFERGRAGRSRDQHLRQHDRGEAEGDGGKQRQRPAPGVGHHDRPNQQDDRDAVHVGAPERAEGNRHEGDARRRQEKREILQPGEEADREGRLPAGQVHAHQDRLHHHPAQDEQRKGGAGEGDEAHVRVEQREARPDPEADPGRPPHGVPQAFIVTGDEGGAFEHGGASPRPGIPVQAAATLAGRP